MTNLISNENELINKLVEMAETFDYLKKKNEEYVKQFAENHHQEIMREKWRKVNTKYRETHREDYNAYSKVKNLKYYYDNKEKISQQRAIRYKEKKEEKRLKDLAEKNLQLFRESLEEIQKIE